MLDPNVSLVTITGLAGSGKTTVLQCLWDKYGKNSGTSWVYLVFNRRNRIEAGTKFEGLEKIYTTNSFLGEQLRKNTHLVRQTDISMDFGGAQFKLQSAIDSPSFKRLFESINDITVNKFVAKVASDYNKPNGQKTVTPEEVEFFLENLDINKFYGVLTWKQTCLHLHVHRFLCTHVDINNSLNRLPHLSL